MTKQLQNSKYRLNNIKQPRIIPNSRESEIEENRKFKEYVQAALGGQPDFVIQAQHDSDKCTRYGDLCEPPVLDDGFCYHWLWCY